MKVSILVLVSVIFTCDGLFHQSPVPVNGPAVQLIEKHGYVAEVHQVETPDGYQLQLHRIMKQGVKTYQGFPVLMLHGLLGSSTDYVILNRNSSLAFSLVDVGFDVWLGNLRGNMYSRRHKTLSPNQPEFWNFSWHESGIFDLPSMIDYICSVTNSKKVNFIGHSMGTTAYFVMTSSKIDYNRKINQGFLLGPMGYVKNTQSPILKKLSDFIKKKKEGIKNFITGEFNKTKNWLASFSEYYCQQHMSDVAHCGDPLHLLHGIEKDKYDQNKLDDYSHYYPAGFSNKALHHYAQNLDSGRFSAYDYGLEENKKIYNRPKPPCYDVDKITAKTHLIVAPNDKVSHTHDTVNIAKKIESVEKIHLIDKPDFNHLDFVIDESAKDYIYEKITERIKVVPKRDRAGKMRALIAQCVPF